MGMKIHLFIFQTHTQKASYESNGVHQHSNQVNAFWIQSWLLNKKPKLKQNKIHLWLWQQLCGAASEIRNIAQEFPWWSSG